MGTLKARSSSPQPSSSPTLPPGCRFYPSEEELLSFYLHNKIHNSSPTNTNSFYDAIKEINLYNFNPFELPDITCFRFGCRGRKRHWYCYTAALFDGGGGGGGREGIERRRAGFGFWKRKGRVRDVTCDGGKVILGRRKCFIFYKKKCDGGKSVTKTDWFMYEYALIDNLKASFVVCRVFVKSRNQNSLSEHALTSGAEESSAKVRHIGIQYDGSAMSVLDEKENCQNRAIEMNTGEARALIRDIQPNNLVTSLGLGGSTSKFFDSVSPRHLETILEGDFLELDDLV